MHPNPAEPAFQPVPDGALPLPGWGLIRAHGADARKFLQGQLSQEMQQWPPGQARLAGYCSAKGRLLASFTAWSPSADEVLLACSADVLAPTLKRLQMFVLRAAVKLSDASPAFPAHGLAGSAAATALAGLGLPPLAPWHWHASADGATLLRLPDAVLGAVPHPRWLWWGSMPPALSALPSLLPQHWAGLEVHSGVPRISAATVEQFVPQMVNLELVGGVSFSKGCYPGQEVVARSQYRGTLKRRAFVLHGAVAMEAPTSGQEVFHAADPGQPAGRVVNSGLLSDGTVSALVELKIAAFDDPAHSLHLGAPDGPALLRGTLPYALTAEETAEGAV